MNAPVKKPADILIERFKAAGYSGRALASLLNVDHSRLVRWRQPAAKGGTDGLIPSSHQRAVLELALERGVAITAEEVVYGER